MPVFHVTADVLPITPGSNPLQSDHFHIGTMIGKDLMVLHKCGPDEHTEYVILCHIPTGMKIKVVLPEFDFSKVDLGVVFNTLIKESTA